MSDEEYNKKLESLQSYIPFLDNMIAQLKDPNKKNREQQLTKMESLHTMITDRKKKLKLETLNKCEDVISKLYMKVNHKQLVPGLDNLQTQLPQSPIPHVVSKDGLDNKSATLSSDTPEPESRIERMDVYKGATETLKEPKPPEKKVISPERSKPPISLDDIKCLEVDVRDKINESASLKELNEMRNKIATELIFEKIKSLNPHNSKSDSDTNVPNPMSEGKSKDKNASHPKSRTKVIKESCSIFGKILSSVDDVNKEKSRKKDERKNPSTKDDKSNKTREKCKDDTKNKDANLFEINSLKHKSQPEVKSNSGKTQKDKETTVIENKNKIRDPRVAKDKSVTAVLSALINTSGVVNNRTETELKSLTPYKRLADKYNPKPRKASLNADVDRVVTESIEQNMKSSPPKIPVINRLTDLPPPPASLVKCSQLEPELPTRSAPIPSLMNMNIPRMPPLPSSRSTLGQSQPQVLSPRDNFIAPQSTSVLMSPRDNFISAPNNNVLMSPRDNFISAPNNNVLMSPRDNFLSTPNNNVLMSPRDNFVSASNSNILMSPRDNFVSEYVREEYNAINPRRPHYEPRTPHLPSNNRFITPSNHRFNTAYNNFNQNHIVDHGTTHHARQYGNVIPPLPSPEVPYFHESKHAFGGNMKRDMYLPKEDLRWRIEDNRPTPMWERRDYDPRSRGPMTYREHREMRENSRDPRVSRDPRELRERDPREPRERDPREPRERDNKDIRDPRLKNQETKDKETDEIKDNKDTTGKSSRDPRLNRNKEPTNRYESKFDRMYSRTNRNESPSRPRTPPPSQAKTDTFLSPLDSLYNPKEVKTTGKGYGKQHFRIPKKKKEEQDLIEEVAKDKKDSHQTTAKRTEDTNQDVQSSTVDESEENDDTVEFLETTGSDNEDITDKKDEMETTENIDDSSSINESEVSEIKESKETTSESEAKPCKKPETVDSEISSSTDVNTKVVEEPEVHTSKPEESSKPEQTILAQFFANLLGTDDKKGKKAALYSLISTFSDSFSTKDLSKIKKIIHANNEDKDTSEEDEERQVETASKKEQVSTTEEDTSKKPDVVEEEIAPEQLQVPESNLNENVDVVPDDGMPSTNSNDDAMSSTNSNDDGMPAADDDDDDMPSTNSIRKLRSRRILSLSPSKECSIDDSIPATDKADVSGTTTEIVAPDTVEAVESEVLVTVGERIKSRKRNAASMDKPKKNYRSELDKLHEDIQEMFIRDGVLTASGKRMCHLLKDDPTVFDAESLETSGEELVKIRKKPGPKPKCKQQQSNEKDLKAMKHVRVIIHKIPESTMEESRNIRRLTRSMTVTESDNEDSSVTSDISNRDVDMEDKDSSDSEKEESISQLMSDNNQKTKTLKRKRVRSNWASGIIRKKKKKNAADEISEQKSPEVEQLDKDTFLPPDKDYYVDFINSKSYACRLCDFQGKFITTHYKNVHPDSEVMSSRFAPTIAAEAIADAKLNMDRYVKYQMVKPSAKITYVCRFCMFNTNVVPTHFYDHISTHTGEYRHVCPNCTVSFCSAKTLKVHMVNTHKLDGKAIARKSYGTVVLFGYICGECNYVQMQLANMEEHVNIYHLIKPTIYKINLSSCFDEEIEKLYNMEAKVVESMDDSSTLTPVKHKKQDDEEGNGQKPQIDTSDTVKRKKKNLKPAKPKKKACKQSNKVRNETLVDSTSKNDASTAKVPATVRRSIDDLNPDMILPLRCRRAAKDKAQEKLKEIMEMNDNVTKKKSVDVVENKEREKPPEEVQTEKESSSNIDPLSTDKDVTTSVVDETLNTSNVAEEKPLLSTKLAKNEAKLIKKEIEMNVFTCKTDILEENRKIEEERLQKMEELNKTVGSRTSLNFVDELCNRLNQNEVIVKEEPHDDFLDIVHQPVRSSSPLTMPVLQKNPSTLSAVQIKKPVLETEPSHASSNPSYDVSQKNDKNIVSMIEKLKGKLNADDSFNMDSGDDYENEGPPPLTHVNELTNVTPFDTSAEIIEICGMLKVVKTETTVTFCCLVPPCVFSSEDKDLFQKHCGENHTYTSLRSSSLCESCGVQITSTPESNLLENLFKHTIIQHEDFAVVENKAIPPAVPTQMLRIRKLSGDALSLFKDDETNTNNDESQKTIKTSSDAKVTNPTENNTVDDNPFPFKIAGVMSLAEPPQPPPLTPINKSNMQILVKEAKLTTIESTKPKKSQKAMSKFVEEVGNLYKCPHYYCLFSSSCRDELEKHMRTHQQFYEANAMIPCVYCDLKTPWEHVAIHIDIRHGNCKFACSYCLYRACSKDYVFLHQDREHPLQEYSVVAIPATRTLKKFAIADVKHDPKSLCNPYKCIPGCSMQFLFENEFRDHLMEAHKCSSFITCGHEHCNLRVSFSKIVQHWSTAHSVSVYQCGHCRANSNELSRMYHHLSQVHQNMQPEIFVRIITPRLPTIIGYTAEAFKRMRKIATLPNITEGDKGTATSLVPQSQMGLNASNKDVPAPSNVSSSHTATKIVFTPTLASTITSSAQNVYLVTHAPTGTNSFIKLSPTPSTCSKKINMTTSVTPSSVMSLINPAVVEPVVSNVSTDPLAITLPNLLSEQSNVTLLPQLSNINDLDLQEELNNTPSTSVANTTIEENALAATSNIAPLEHVNLNDASNQDESMECDVDPLDLGDSLALQNVAYSSEDESDSAKSKKKSGLLGYQLFRCAICDFSCSNSIDFRKHVAKSLACKSQDNIIKPYTCIHCKKTFRNANILCDHVQCHGILRFSCSLCGNKFPTSGQARSHMKHRHNVSQTTQTPLNPGNAAGNEEFLIKPKLTVSDTLPKESPSIDPALAISAAEYVYYPDQIDKIPIRSIFSSDLKCGSCTYSTKVRTNMVRHLQFHSQEKSVPDTAPVNPVPCLEKNEKMFDKMINLASSSHKSAGRMGGSVKPEASKGSDNIPDYVPSHTRYACCAQGCNYICPEEGNLRHHLMALHDEETDFICVHCKIKLTPTDADSLIKHLKLHSLQLHKCHYCDFVHNLKHKVEKHCNDDHSDVPLKIITIRCMETEPKDKEDALANPSPTPVPIQNKHNKPWRCCMCKNKSATQEGIQNHVLEKHEIDSQYKCALCAYKTNDKNTFGDHFKEQHQSQDIDIIPVYQKIEDDPKEDKDSDPFDTTPLWQRDRPRVRHIRGILFDESSPVASKSPKKPTKTPPIPVSCKATSKNLDLSINAVATGSADVLKDNGGDLIDRVNKLMKTTQDVQTKETEDIIIIEDEEEKSKNNKDSSSVAKCFDKKKFIDHFEEFIDVESDYSENEFNEMDLLRMFGAVGQPLNKQLKCPDCNKFKSKRISDFIFHMFKEKKVYRFKCRICGDESITYRYMFKHVKEHKTDLDINDIITMPRNPKLEIWLQMLIRLQCVKIVTTLQPPLDTAQNDARRVLCRYCNKWYKSEQERNEHAIFHWNCIPFKCSLCDYDAFVKIDMINHFASMHSTGRVPDIIECGPTVTKELQFADFLHMKEAKEEVNKLKLAADSSPVKASIAEVLVPEAVVHNMVDESEQDGTVQGMSAIDLDTSDKTDDEPCVVQNTFQPPDDVDVDVDDLVIVTKTDTNVPHSGDVFCCEYCPYMSNSEMLMLSHISGQHEHMHIKFKVLNKETCEKKTYDYVACSICDEVGSEITIRQHYLELHEGETFNFYRFTCSGCQKRFIKISGIKMHFQRIHPGVPLKCIDIFDNVISDQIKSSKEKSTSKITESSSSSHARSATPTSSIHSKTWKRYYCTECTSYERDFLPNSLGNIRSHVRNHFKAYICGDCGLRIRTKTDGVAHYKKEHPHSKESIIHDTTVEKQFHEALRVIYELAEPIPEPGSSTTQTSPHRSPSRSSTKITARKSTSCIQLPTEEYSFYGNPPDPVDLAKIMTSVKMNGTWLDMPADKLGNIFNLNCYVYSKKCDAPLDDEIIEIDS